MKLFSSLNRFAFSSASTSPLATQVLLNSNRNAIRFENQNRTWTFSELDTHTNAFAYGLTELGWKAGDKLLLWVEKNHTSEIATAQVAAAKIGITLFPVSSQSAQELQQALSDTSAKGILFSPNSKLGESRYIDVINQAIPELSSTPKGASLNTKFPSLKHVLHTGFYSFPGTYKFRQVMVYASKNFNTLSLPNFDLSAPLIVAGNKTHSLKDLIAQSQQQKKAQNLSNDTAIFITGDARTSLSFSLGVLNSLLHGNYSVYTGAQELNQVGQSLQHFDKPLLLVDGDVVKATTAGIKHKEHFSRVGSVVSSENTTQDSLKKQAGLVLHLNKCMLGKYTILLS